MPTNKYFKCPFCDKRLTREDMVTHIEKYHEDELPEGFTPLRATFHAVNRKDFSYVRPCRMCKSPTKWDEAKGRYDQLCGSRTCHDAQVEKMRKDMGDKLGINRQTATAEGLQKMLANRKISGIYTWSDGVYKVSYTGSYELEFLKFLDLDLFFDPKDIMAPSPHTYYYVYEGKKHFYIPDFFIPSLGLEIEIKDGGDNPNTHHKIQDVDKVKERLKDAVMKSNKNTFSYIKIENKNHIKFLQFLTLMKERIHNGENEKIFMP